LPRCRCSGPEPPIWLFGIFRIIELTFRPWKKSVVLPSQNVRPLPEPRTSPVQRRQIEEERVVEQASCRLAAAGDRVVLPGPTVGNERAVAVELEALDAVAGRAEAEHVRHVRLVVAVRVDLDVVLDACSERRPRLSEHARSGIDVEHDDGLVAVRRAEGIQVGDIGRAVVGDAGRIEVIRCVRRRHETESHDEQRAGD